MSDSFLTSWTVAHQDPLSREFSGQKYCELPFSPPGDLPDPGINLTAPAASPALQTDALPLSH